MVPKRMPRHSLTGFVHLLAARNLEPIRPDYNSRLPFELPRATTCTIRDVWRNILLQWDDCALHTPRSKLCQDLYHLPYANLCFENRSAELQPYLAHCRRHHSLVFEVISQIEIAAATSQLWQSHAVSLLVC